MAESSIEWTRYTWSPWEGCQKAGPGCDNCYAEARNRRFSAGANWGPGAPRRRTADWTKPRLWNRAAAAAGTRERVFPSLCDPFDNTVDSAWRSDLFDLIRATPHLDWLLLTKRIGNVPAMLPPDWGQGYANVWIGATIVNRAEMLRDGPKLRKVPACIRFWSYEPALGDIGRIPRHLMPEWIIAGGESGPHARSAKEAWFSDLRDQCVAAGTAFLFKQWGTWGADGVRRSKKENGRELAGRPWDQFPVPAVTSAR